MSNLLNIRHCGISVRNLKKSYTLYKDILRLKYISSNFEQDEYIQDLLNLKELIWVKLSTQNGSIIELYWIPTSNYKTYNHIAFTVDNINKLRFDLIGIDLECSPIKTNKEGTCKVMMVRDFDQNLLEMVEEIK